MPHSTKSWRLFLVMGLILATILLEGCGSAAYNQRFEKRGDALRYGENR
jgi:hypothetical protein